ncbi:hypothetical protein QBC41DRAFT_234693 [Cercophora samala]|uniref:Fucose-specific lectin n=1 Tax=Cercophora samala TaxID=330535 RepID=A0AA40D4P6_9PEZI|nr:hypothetical protein QBC41DRAFT_234693 [Cercophora samala]
MAHSTSSVQPSVQRSSPHPFDDQPGLEVVPHDNLPEVRPEEEPKFCLSPVQDQEQKIQLSEEFPEVIDDKVGLGVGSPASTEKGTLPVSKPYQRRKWYIIGGTASVVVAIIIGVTLGVVLSLKARNNDSTAAVNGTSGPQTIRPGSKLSAVGWRKADGDIERYLFYLDPQGQIRRSRSITRGNSTPTWEVLPGLDLEATNGTSLAATIALYGTEYNPQTELYYETDSKVFGAIFNEARQPNILIDNVSGGLNRGLTDLTMGTGARLAAYWPYLVTQHESGHIIQARQRLGDPSQDVLGSWSVQNLTIPAYEGGSLCIVPSTSNFSKITTSKGHGVIYQKPDQSIAIHFPEDGNNTVHHVPSDQLPEQLPDEYLFPPQAPMAAFALARNDNDDSNDLVNIYLIIKSYTGRFGVWLAENSSSWKEEWPDVFRKVDEDSDIACSSLAVTNSDWEGKEVPLAPDNVRCYFQRDGAVVEVGFGPSGWTEIGVVPIP